MLNDKVNDLFGFTLALADFISLLIGSYFYEVLGMRKLFDYTALFNLIIVFIFIVF